jgi:catechol 2,3-dioxygenase-like lactoylglutathione lyase family enzyme
MIRNVGHFGVTVSDIDRSVAFYRDVLGFELGMTAELEGDWVDTFVGYPGAKLKIAFVSGFGGELEFLQYGNPKSKPWKNEDWDIGSAHVGFTVDDIQKTYQDWKSKGVRFVSEPVQMMVDGKSAGWICHCLDPDGIMMELTQPG